MAHLTIRRGPSMTTARNGQAAVALADGRVAILGGSVPPKGECGMGCVMPMTASVEIYDPKTGKFRRNGSLVHPRRDATAVLLRDGRVLLTGGYIDGGAKQYLEIYNPARGVSTAVKQPATVPDLTDGSTVAVLGDGRVLIAGGWHNDDLATTSNATLLFNPTNLTFAPGPDLVEPRQYAAATVLGDGHVLIAGGERFVGGETFANDSAELIDPGRPDSASRLVESPPGSLSRQARASVRLSDGRVLLPAGDELDTGNGCSVAATATIFDPTSGSFTSTGQLRAPRTGAALIPLRDGRALLVGGVDASCQAARTIEAFDPASGSFAVVATTFPQLYSGFTATRLGNDHVLVTSGEGGGPTWLLEP